MLLKIAWRNIWRQRRRSLIVMTSIIIGNASILLYDSIAIGFTAQKLENEIGTHVSHIQINSKGYNNNKVIGNKINDPEFVASKIKSLPFVTNYSTRIITFGMLTSAENSSGTTLVGINPNKESEITSIKSMIVKGEYVSNNNDDIVIGTDMAEKLNVSIGDKIVMIAAAVDGSVQSELFRICGIFKSSSSEFNKNYVYVNISAANSMLKMNNAVTQFVMLIDNTENTSNYREAIAKKLGSEYEVFSYADLLPLLIVYVDLAKQMMIILYIIIGIAILFGIINTMLMSVFERIQEIGVLMSIGMRNNKIFLMIVQEAFLLGSLGTLLGMLIGLIFYYYFAINGINLSAFSDSLESLGIGTSIYPILDNTTILRSLIIMPLTTVFGAIYPAIKAIKLLPTTAMRYI